MRQWGLLNWLMFAIFFMSTLSAIYSLAQIYVTEVKADKALLQFSEELSSPEYLDEQKPVIKATRFSQTHYEERPKVGEVFAKIEIPSIKLEAAIIEGTGVEQLDKGVGHYEGSVLPGETDNTVLAGHRDTVFKSLKNVEIGDIVRITTAKGTFVYEIQEQLVVDKHDRTIIVPTESATITIITCYPFDFIGPAPERFILQGVLIDET
ncbi:class D sortase [Salirhabdus salicampi]|uniref:class D sortase n=1 Tax=Salirhabdus salicampi TaxID=476102 RepID=UPI0020C3111F|nr:class D sortase [Salirhabdus salicampi]MCP8616238.1 class D sortase [Salirhabdus salicampi]